MALESLQWEVPTEFTHEPRHDLESLFYVILTICTYVDSPGYLRSPVPVENERSLCLNEWWATLDGNVLARSKASHVSSLEYCVLQRLPPYWEDFHQVLIDLRDAIWPEKNYVLHVKNLATHDAFLSILTTARDMYRGKGEAPCPYAPISDRQAGYGASQKRKGKDSDAIAEAKRTKVLTETTLSLNRTKVVKQPRSSQAPILACRSSARIADRVA